jgi:hypothetical protein
MHGHRWPGCRLHRHCATGSERGTRPLAGVQPPCTAPPRTHGERGVRCAGQDADRSLHASSRGRRHARRGRRPHGVRGPSGPSTSARARLRRNHQVADSRWLTNNSRSSQPLPCRAPGRPPAAAGAWWACSGSSARAGNSTAARRSWFRRWRTLGVKSAERAAGGGGPWRRGPDASLAEGSGDK